MWMLKFKALADETRLRLINILIHNELSVNELVQILRLGQSRVSRHLKILAEAGLLQWRRDGLWVFYSTPRAGANADFLRAILPFFPQGAPFSEDAAMATRILEDRAARARQFFNIMAEKWDDLNREILENFDLPAKVCAAMPKNCQSAVDLGCGTGAVLAKMSAHAKTLIGVDGSAAMLDLCHSRMSKQNVNDISLRIGQLSHLPLANHEAEFACINLVLHHLPVPATAFTEIHRILKPDGILFVADFLKHDDESMRTHYGDYWLGFERDALISCMESAGFNLVSTELCPVGRNLTLLIVISRADFSGDKPA